MSFQAKPALTDAGAVLISRCIAGTSDIYFTAFGAGSGSMDSESQPQSMIARILRFSISEVDDETAEQITISGSFSSTDAPADFVWRELGVYATDTAIDESFTGDGTTTVYTLTASEKPENLISVKVNGVTATYTYNNSTGAITFATAPAADAAIAVKYPDYDEEKLYAYANDGDNGGFIRCGASEIVTEQKVDVVIAIGTATDVYVTIAANATYATQEALNTVSATLTAHQNNVSNPHGVTASQLGLGNVSAPTYTVPASLTAMASGEILSTAFGKISKAVNSLIAHLANTSNPHGVTYSQVGAAAASHTHTSAEIIGGASGCVVGYYTGNLTTSRTITLGFRPKAVYVCIAHGMPEVQDSSADPNVRISYSGFGIDGYTMSSAEAHALDIVAGGFTVYCHRATASRNWQIDLNQTNTQYIYVAFK